MNPIQTRAIHFVLAVLVSVGFLTVGHVAFGDRDSDDRPNDIASQNAQNMVKMGRHTFRFDTFGDEAFWGDELKLHKAFERVSPATALGVGLKVDVEALPKTLVGRLQSGHVDLNSPETTLALLRLNAVIGVTGFFNRDGSLKSMGIQCAFCHSAVDSSFAAPGIPAGMIGHRLDGWPNRDLNVGAIVSLSPDLSVPAKVLGVDDATLRKVLKSWGPGKFDAEVFMDGKGFTPSGGNAATLIPPAYGLAGFNLHTWTAWGSVPYWNAFVANLEMHGQGRFFDPRLSNAAQFPVAARNGFDNVQIDPALDRITPKLAALHFYQLAIPAPKPPASGFSRDAADRGKILFNGRAECSTCHTPPLFTEPGWNAHKAAEVCVDDFQSSRSPDKVYRTAPLAGLFFRQKGGFYHDGRFASLADVINHYVACKGLRLNENERSDLVQYLLSF